MKTFTVHESDNKFYTGILFFLILHNQCVKCAKVCEIVNFSLYLPVENCHAIVDRDLPCNSR